MEIVLTQYDTGKEAIGNFMQSESTAEKFSPKQELALLLLTPTVAQQNNLSFTEFKDYYRGVYDALTSIKEMVAYLPQEKTSLIPLLEKSCREIANLKDYQDLKSDKTGPLWLKKLQALITELVELNITLTNKIPTPDRKAIRLKRVKLTDALAQLKSLEKRKAATITLINLAKELESILDTGNIYEKDLNWLLIEITSITKILVTEHDFMSQKDYKNYLEFMLELSQKSLMLAQCPQLFYCRFDQEQGLQEIDVTATYLVRCLLISRIHKSALPEHEHLLDYASELLEEVMHDVSLSSKTFGRKYALHKLKRFMLAVRYLLGDCTAEETIAPSFEKPIETTILGEKSIAIVLKEYSYLLEIFRRSEKTITKLL